MTPETLAALEASIARWHDKLEMARTDEGMLAIEIGIDACPLCRMFNSIDCEGCPVACTAEGHPIEYRRWCADTPFEDADPAYTRWLAGYSSWPRPSLADLDISRSGFRSAARREIRFLTSLLPPAATRDDIVGEAGLGWGRAS